MKNKYVKRYLATMNVNKYSPALNHGIVEINDKGFLKDGTPVEDYGGFIIQDNPFPANQKELDQMFFDLIKD